MRVGDRTESSRAPPGKAKLSIRSLKIGLAGIALAGLASPRVARADTPYCEFLRQYIPNLYERSCKGGTSRNRAAAGSGSASVSDTFNINPATLPTEPSPFGIELIHSAVRSEFGPTHVDLSFIKGFHKIGTGVSTNSNSTFYGNDIVHRAKDHESITSFDPIEPAKGQLPNLNLGTSINLKKLQNGATISLGLAVRYNKITNGLGGGTGIVVNHKYYTFGGGFVQERVSNYFGPVQFYSAVAGVKYAIFDLEYTWLSNSGGYSLGPIHIGSLSLSYERAIVTFAMRKLNYFLDGDVVQRHWAIQYQFTSHFTAGYLWNYIPGTSSLAAQIYF